MSALQQWMLLFCCGCVLYGVLENILPRKGIFPVIKTVIVLYILLILLSPSGFRSVIKNVRLPDFQQEISLPDTQSGFDESLRRVLQQRVAAVLAVSGENARVVRLELSIRNGQISQVSIRLHTEGECDRQKLMQLCDDCLGLEGSYEFEDG